MNYNFDSLTNRLTTIGKDKYFVGSKNYQGYEICMMKDDKKYYLSKLSKDINKCSWSSDHTYARHFKLDKAQKIIDMLNGK